MISQDIRYKLLNYDMTEKKLFEYLDIDFNGTIIGILNALYELLVNYDKNEVLINDLLSYLELFAKKEENLDNIKNFHVEVKRLIGNIHRNLKPITDTNLSMFIKRLQVISRYLKQLMINADATRKIKIMESIINDNRNLKVISALIRDNKNILKIKDNKNENILYKLLKKYSYLSDDKEIDYLYQVISLFINNDDINIEIIRSIDYYISALENRRTRHVRKIRRELEFKKQPIALPELEKRFGIYLSYSDRIEQELNSFRMLHNGAIDFTDQPSYTIDGEGSECLDDAIYFKRNEDGSFTLYVHITYIPSLIPYMSKMNRESIRRVETYYLTDGAYTLYPRYVSDHLASLLPNNIRYTETGIWLIEPNMTIVEDSFRLVKSTIKTQHRLTYDEADIIIGSKLNEELCQSLTDLGRFALRQREKNKTKEKYRKLENSTSPIHESRFVDTSVSANIVQECALLFSRSKAELAMKKGIPYIYRACGEIKSLDLDGEILKNFNLDSSQQLSNMVAYYTETPERHCGLGYNAYCHGGSPARRSPDGQNQYIDEALIFTSKLSDKTVYFWEEKTRQLVSYYNEATQRIDAFSSQYNYLMNKKLIKKL